MISERMSKYLIYDEIGFQLGCKGRSVISGDLAFQTLGPRRFSRRDTLSVKSGEHFIFLHAQEPMLEVQYQKLRMLEQA